MRLDLLVRLVSVAVLAVVPCAVARAADPITAAALLGQAKQAARTHPDRLPILLEQLHQNSGQLTPAQRWQLRELDAWQLSFEGDYGKADPIFQDIIDHSGDPSVSALATAWLIKDKFDDHHYVEAYTLANTLMANLPKVTDPKARRVVLGRVIDILNSPTVGQYGLALSYARQMKTLFPSPAGQCSASMHETQALLFAGKLSSSNPRFKETIDLCVTADQPLLVGAIRLEQASHMVDEGHTRRAVTYLQRMASEIQRTRYPEYIAGLSVILAQAYQRQGNSAKARKLALASLATPGTSGARWLTQTAYDVLYEAEKKAGHDAAALAYYEKYVALDKAAMDDAKARALAYQMVRQQVLAKKMKLDALSKQNRILQLRQALANQAQKTSRLYNALLLVVIAFITLVMFWLRRSQLRFRRMARHDGLTEALNRGHFFDEVGRALRRLHKADANACLIVLDLDHFKRVNDTHGHAIGDEVLRHAVTIVRRELRDSGLLGRLGGEEFGILVPGCSRRRGLEIANRIRGALAATPMTLDTRVSILATASFGLACTDRSGHALRQLLIDADAALYQAKDGGRNQVVEGICAESPAVDDGEAVSA